jgi:hypothetical protein
MSRSVDFPVEATPDGALERWIDSVCGYGGLSCGVLAVPWAACGRNREDFMREGRRTWAGATSAWISAADLAVGLTERPHRRSAYDELIDRILGRGHH